MTGPPSANPNRKAVFKPLLNLVRGDPFWGQCLEGDRNHGPFVFRGRSNTGRSPGESRLEDLGEIRKEQFNFWSDPIGLSVFFEVFFKRRLFLRPLEG